MYWSFGIFCVAFCLKFYILPQMQGGNFNFCPIGYAWDNLLAKLVSGTLCKMIFYTFPTK